MFKKIEETGAEFKILLKVVESLQQSKYAENFSAGNIFPLKCELEIRKFEGKCVDSSLGDTVVCAHCSIQWIKVEQIILYTLSSLRLNFLRDESLIFIILHFTLSLDLQ